MNTMQVSTLEEKLFGAMKGFVTRSFADLERRIDEIAKRAPEKGEKGEPGKNADPALIEQHVAKAQEALTQRLDAAVARIPVPKDGENGKSVTVEDVRPLLTAEVARMELEFERRAGDILQRAIDKIPAPVNGKDADEEEIAGRVLKRVMSALEEITAPKDGAPGLNGDPGRDGSDGRDGKDVDPEVVRMMVRDEVAKAVAEIPRPRDGVDGKSVELPELMGAIMDAATKAVAAIPVPKDGRDGKDGENGKDGRDGSDGLNGKDGTDGLAGKDGANGLNGKDGADGIHGKDGLSIKGDPGRDGIDGTSVTLADVTPIVETAVTKAVLDLERRGMDAISRAIDKIPAPKDGAHGKDGRDGVNGRDGVSLDAFDVSLDDDGQTLVFTLATPECELVRKVRTPMPVYRGVYTAGHYTKGSSATYGGSQWIAECDTDEPPKGPSNHWRLAVKAGRDAK